jgi:hypothetical protein
LEEEVRRELAMEGILPMQRPLISLWSNSAAMNPGAVDERVGVLQPPLIMAEIKPSPQISDKDGVIALVSFITLL